MIFSLTLLLLVSVCDQTPKVEGYECEYLKSHKELVCHCTRENINIRHVSLLTRGSRGHVESLKIEHCQYVDINFDMLDIVQPFYQVRLENIGALSVNNVMLRQKDNLDIIIRNVKSRVTILGVIQCVDCGHQNSSVSKLGDIRDLAQPTLILQIKDSSEVQLEYLDVANINLRFSVNNVEKINIYNAVIEKAAKDSVQILNVENVNIRDTAIVSSTDKAVSLNLVDTVTVSHTIGISADTFNILSDGTVLDIKCTAQYQNSDLEHSDRRLRMLDWDLSECGSLSETGPGHRGHDLPSTAIPITIISVIICALTVFIMLIILCQMHRNGKLDRFL